jgi:hypothetical protein
VQLNPQRRSCSKRSRDTLTHDGFNNELACCECLQGQIEVAKARLKHALKIESSLRMAALDEPDLEAIWDSL